MRHLRRLAAAASLMASTPLCAQSVEGRVFDRATDQPIAEAAVSVLNGSGRVVARTLADTAGRFALPLNGAGMYRLRAERIGYRPATSSGFDVAAREVLGVDLRLSAGAVELDPLTITSRPEPPRSRYLEVSGFYERERTAPGTFMRREAVQRNNRSRMSEILATLPGARRSTVQGRTSVSFGRSTSGGINCSPSVFIDGQPIVRPEVIDDIVHVGAIEALEVYRGPSQTPPRFAGSERGCGVIVIWTQRRV